MRQILISNNLASLSAAAAELFIRLANEAIETKGSFSVALAGGTTPRSLYLLLASRYRDATDWSKATFFFGDERNVAPDSPASNYRMANETLLAPLGIDARNVHRWRTELDAFMAAVDYEMQLRQHFGTGIPRFEVFCLGLGDDSHTASLFPRCPAVRETRSLAVSTWVGKLGEHRLTITFPVISNSANVIFLVSGSEKAEAVANVLEGQFRPDEYPAQLVKPAGGDLYWLLDEAAASSLKGP